jgi:glycosyltransferase involved in cell wall biosynthesis
MRILIAHEAVAGAGGVESYLATLIPALIARGHQVAFLHHNPRSETGPTRLDHPDMLTVSVMDVGLDGAVATLRAWSPDICFSHNMGELDVDARLAAEWPVVKMMHGYFGTCVSGQKAHAFPAVQPCSRRFGAACLALYMPRHCGQLRPAVMLKQYEWTARQQRLFASYAHVVVASDHMAAEYVRNGISRERITTTPLFPAEMNTTDVRPLPADPAVLFAGRMTSIKGGDVLIRAIAAANRGMNAPARLVLAGDGPEKDSWRALADRLGVTAELTGWLSGESRTALFRRATILAVPSLWPEPFGLVGLEAGVHGVPAVAFNTGGIGQWLRDGVNGRLVQDVGNADALGAAIAAVLSEPAHLRNLGEGAQRIATQLSVGSHLDLLERVFVRATKMRAASRPGAAGRTSGFERKSGPTFHLLTGEYPPGAGGVGDYTQLVAQALARRGCDVHVWTPSTHSVQDAGGVHVHALPDSFGRRSREVLDDALTRMPGCVLVQYVPNALGMRGANLPFCLWLRGLGRRADVRVMFHEPYFYFGWHPYRNALAAVQRMMASVLLGSGPVAYISTATWRARLGRWAPRGVRFEELPVPSTVPSAAEPAAIAAWRERFTGGETAVRVVGHFGTYGRHMSGELEPLIPAIMRGRPDVRLVCMGTGSDAFATAVPAEWRSRVHGTGALAGDELAAALRACDVIVQPYPDGVTTRRTSVMAALANETAVVTTAGALTERVWADEGAVVLVPAGQPAAAAAAIADLFRDSAARASLAARGRRAYEAHFALEHTIDALLGTAQAACA